MTIRTPRIDTIEAGTLTNGLLGKTTGAAIPAGYVGEILTNSTSSVPMTIATYTDAGTLTLTPGVWDVVGYVLYSPAASTSITRFDTGIGTASGTGTTGLTVPSTNNIEFMAATVPGNDIWKATPIVRVNISVSTPYYLKARSNFTVSTMTCGGYIRATRIA